MRTARLRRGRTLLPVVGLAAATLGGAALGGPAASAATAPAVRLTFNSSLPGIGNAFTTIANSGTLGSKVKIDVATAGGGHVIQVQGASGSGRAARLPSYDGSTSGPRAVVRIRNSGTTDYLSPGTAAFTWSADFQLDSVSSDSTSSSDNGDNLVQHGLTQNQWKLQLDHRRAGCFVSGSKSVVSATTAATVNSTSWYRASCRRSIGGNGAVAGVTVVLRRLDPATGNWVLVESRRTAGDPGNVVALDAAVPMSAGGKLTNDGTSVATSSDQFNGTIDNVDYTLG